MYCDDLIVCANGMPLSEKPFIEPVIKLEELKEKINGLYDTINKMGENTRPYEDQRDAGYDDACLSILDTMEQMFGDILN